MKNQKFSRVFTNAPWETKVGYCRALRVGNQAYVTGTAPIDNDGKVFEPGNAYAQAKRCFEIVRDSLAKLDVPLSQVVRTRMFVTDISKWADFGKAHQEFFGNNPPTTTMVEIKQLIDPKMLIEVEADAYVGGS